MADEALMQYLGRQYAGSAARRELVERLGYDPRDAIIDFLVWADDLLSSDPPAAMAAIGGVPHLLFGDGRGIPVHSVEQGEPDQITPLIGQGERPATPPAPRQAGPPTPVPLGQPRPQPHSVSKARAERPEDYYYPDVEGNDAESAGKTETVPTFSMAGPPRPRKAKRF